MNVVSKVPGAGSLWLRAPSPIGRLGLRWKVVLAAVSFALVPLLVLGFFLNVRSNAAIEDEALRGLEDEARALQAALNETINNHAADALLLAKSDTLYFQSASTQQRREILSNHADVWDYASDIAVVSNQGEVIFSLDADTAYPSQADRLYFQQASQLPEGRVFVGDIAQDEMSGEPVISIAAPAYNEFGTLLGVIRIAWPVSELNSFVADLGRAEDLRISILQGNGTVVASSSGAAFGESPDGLTAVQEALRGQAGTVRESAGGEGDAFIAFAPVQESSAITGLGWAITVDAPADQVFAPVVSNRNWTIALVVIVALLAIVAAVFFAHRLVAPIQRLAVAAREVAGGNYGARVPVAARDEVGTTALAFNQMLDEITGLIQTREDRDRIQQQIIQLLTEVNAVAEGDLTIEAEVTGDELGSVADSFNFMIAELRKIITNVNETTTAVSFASVEIVQSSSELAVSSEHQSEQISGAATAIEEMAVSIQQVSQNADLSSEVAREAQANAQAGAEAVQATIESMNRIRQQVEEAQRTIARLGESSQEIGSIVQVISQIARQTNTLALNASIQAARAGEHGRGFAVVSDEVRRLAERSSNATKQIAGLISSIQSETAEAVVAMDQSTQQVAEGANLADGAGMALAQIDAVVSRLGELIQAISHAAQQQAGTASEISRTMQDINAVTQTTTLGTREAAESVNSLSSLAERLRESVAMFRLSSEQEQSMVGSVADGD